MGETIKKNGPLFPTAKVKLVGRDGNAFAIMGRVADALRKAGATKEQVEEYTKESMGGNYDHLLATAMKWADCR